MSALSSRRKRKITEVKSSKEEEDESLSENESNDEEESRPKRKLHEVVDEIRAESKFSKKISKFQLPKCTHLSVLKFDTVKKKILNPSQWHCKGLTFSHSIPTGNINLVECGETGSIWGCLTCGNVGCGRFVFNFFSWIPRLQISEFSCDGSL
jgi:uncharacterized UBP type Zn finger protein